MSVGSIAGKSDRRSFELENDLSFERGTHEIRICEGNSLVLFEVYIYIYISTLIVKRIFLFFFFNSSIKTILISVESATRNTDHRR